MSEVVERVISLLTDLDANCIFRSFQQMAGASKSNLKETPVSLTKYHLGILKFQKRFKK